jgi:hypothetical protein
MEEREGGIRNEIRQFSINIVILNLERMEEL